MTPDADIQLLAMPLGEERYVIAYRCDDTHRAAALRTIGRWAANPELSFTWLDAERWARRINQERRTGSAGAVIGECDSPGGTA